MTAHALTFTREELTALMQAVDLKRELLLKPDFWNDTDGSRYLLYCQLWSRLRDARDQME